jgi:hypothetical protein
MFGTVFFSVMALAGLIRVMLERPVSGHYRIFTGAARLLQEGRDPYGFDFQTVGNWFYSPACGLFFYSLFSWMPDLIGLFLYSLISVLAFYFSLRYFMREIGHDAARIQWALAFVSIPVYQGLLAAKIETIMMSLFLVGVVGWLRSRYLWSSLLLGFLMEWKFQIAPMAGLLGLWLLLFRRTVRPLVFLMGFAALWHWLPAMFLGWEHLQALLHHQKESLGGFVAESFANYDNLFRFLKETGWKLSFAHSLVVSALSAAALAMMVVWGYFRKEESRVEWMPLLAIALGAVFCIGFSPMNQNNASILGTPVFVFSALIIMESGASVMKFGTILFLLLFHFSYSDLMPEKLRLVLRAYSLKSVLVSAYGAAMVAWVFRGRMTSPEEVPSPLTVERP